jgi:hypothetical protein
LGAPLYPYTDLPETVSLTTPDGTFIGEVQSDYTYVFPDYTPDPGQTLIRAGEEAWIYGDDGGYGGGPCLIQDVGAGVVCEDEFSDTYTVSFLGFDFTITRISLCVWQMDEFNTDCTGFSFPIQVRVEYDPITYKWLMTIVQFSDPDCEIYETYKDDPQSSPVGTYVYGGNDYIVS